MNATNNKLHPDFGYGGGMPYNVVSGSQAKSHVSFYYSGDPGPYPIPSNVNIEQPYDHHAILIDNTNCILYELFNLSSTSAGWSAGSGAIFPLNSNALRPAGLTSADAAGLPIFPGEVRYDEVMSGVINHALRVTVDHTRNQYIWPARHSASSLSGAQYPPMGQRFRLKASFDISSYPYPVQVILIALKKYGLIVADNGPSWHLTGIGDTRWNDTTMHAMTFVTGDNFEAVNESSLMLDPNSAAVRGPNSQPEIPSGWYHIVSKNSGSCLDMTGGPAATWQTDPAQQWGCAGTVATNQQFQFISVAGGYQIQVRNSGLSLQVNGTAADEGAGIEQWPFESQAIQIWSVKTNSNGAYTFSPTSNPNYCLDVLGASKANGAKVDQWACNGGANQQWTLVQVAQ